MREVAKMNFLSPVAETHPRWRRRRIARAMLFTIVLAAAALFTAGAAAPGERFAPILEEITPRILLRGVGRLLLADDRELAGEADDRVNVLLLGIGGEGHDGPQLTDTIILVSWKPSTKQVALLSIPRDLVVEIPGYGWRKVNAVNAFAEANAPGTGGEETARLLARLLGVDIPYYVRVDFAGFRKLIDEVGGVLVYVDRSFTDAEYPAPDDLVQTVSFKAGWQRLDGERALIYARSRHGSNFEGSDFARSRRQQKVLAALKEELLTTGVLMNPARVSAIWDILAQHVRTDIEPREMVKLAGIARSQDGEGMVLRTLDAESGGPLIPALIAGAYVLVPADGNYDAIRAIARDIFASPAAPAAAPSESAGARTVRVEVQNGTTLAGFAAKAADELKTKGFAVSFVANAPSRGYDRSVIYDLSGGRYPEDLARLRALLDADVSVTIPDWFASTAIPPTITVSPPSPQGGKASADFLVILGKSSASLLSS